MADTLQTLALLNGKEIALVQAKNLVDQAGMAIAALQAANAAEKTPIVASLQGVPGIGEYSSVDQALRLERFAGKAATVDYVKANPTCTEAAAIAAWDAAGLIATGLPILLQNTGNLAALYRQNLLAGGYITAATWDAQRAWILATAKATIMGA